MESEKWLG